LGPGIPLALLYASKWWVSKIPDNPLLAERIPVEVDHDAVLRDGEPFAMADTDLVQPVPGLPPGGTRHLSVRNVNLSVVMGRSPFGSGHVVVDAPALVSVGSQLPGSDETGLRAVLPLAVHNTWVVLHDPGGPENLAEVLLMVSGTTDTTARERIYEDIAQRLPELLNGLRLRAARVGRVPALVAAGEVPSPFGDAAGGVVAAPSSGAGGDDPFGGGFGGGGDVGVVGGPVGEHVGDTAVGYIPPTASISFEPLPTHTDARHVRPDMSAVPPGFHEAQTQERQIPEIPGLRRPESQPESGATDPAPPPSPPKPAQQYDPDPFDPFGEGT
jgi:hypothetical protein